MKPFDVKSVVERNKELLKKVIALNDIHPTLAIIQVGNNPASDAYVRGKKKDCEELGIRCVHIEFTEDNTPKDVRNKIIELNNDDSINGIIVQLPLPKYWDEDSILRYIKPEKDVDGFLPDSPYTPCTPLGIMTLLEENGIEVQGKNTVVIGRSNIVGKPMASLLIRQNATVTLCHSYTPREKLKDFCRNADIIVCAVGHQNFFTPDFLGAVQVIIDVGINRDENGKLCGDMDPACHPLCDESYYTPVPGGVGLLTRYSLMQNTYMAALNQKLTSEKFCGIIKEKGE